MLATSWNAQEQKNMRVALLNCVWRVLLGLWIIFVDIFLIKATPPGFASRNKFQLNAKFRIHLVLDIML